MTKEQKTADLLDTLRKECGSITLKEIIESESPQLTDTELMARAADCEIFFPKYLDKVLRLMIYNQLEKTVGENIDVQFGRGTINGIYLIQQWFKDQVNISRSRLKTEEKPTPGEITG
jgi:hypothetical protein